MQLDGDRFIPASPARVWEGLNDPEVLARAIPGCDSLKAESADRLVATVKVSVGPIAARFQGDVEISDRRPLEGYTLTGSGSAGPEGTAKGVARITLTPEAEGTRLRYVVDVDVSGKIAGLGARLMGRVADANVALFFERLERELVAPDGRAPQAGAPQMRAADTGQPALANAPKFALLDRLAWLGSGVGLTLAILLICGAL